MVPPSRVHIPNGISIGSAVLERPFVKWFALCYRTFVLLSLLSVTLIYCGQMVGWIKVKLDVEVGLGPGHIVLDGGRTSPLKGPPVFGPCLF